jgi:hypothetical protein
MDAIAHIVATKDHITITVGNDILCDLPGDLIRPVLGLVSILIDEEIPALLDKGYINREADWKHELTAMLVPDDMFSGEW